ncbi:MAG: 4-(cytidine 5'-diphospho)-2-C-methyl-D-erythritol kinase [Verrucomicrobiaceae bacterium]|nr:4-(cytidine 5'-diphospho)-2-C-methyl-D-erythritol kinase [Verrucomicrobiaceae bacterium]
MSMTLHSPAKINLSLRVLGKRSDGFHAIETRLVKLAFGDEVKVELCGEEKRDVVFTCSDVTVPADESNLALRALRAFESRTGRERAWRIHLEKRIPHGAGLGGGSSNAATVLHAVNALVGHPLSQTQLLEPGGAARLGCAVFLLESAAADGTGRGEIVVPVAFPHELQVVLIKPPFPIPTPWAYQRWAASKELPEVLYAPQICPWGEMVNDLERPVFEKHHFLPALKNWLLSQGEVRAALMSGSGSTMFAIAQSGVAAGELAEKARAWCGDTCWIQVTRTQSH